MEPDIAESEVAELRRAWLEHPLTRKLLQELKGNQDGQQRMLLNACHASPDPKVQGIYANYFTLGRIIAEIEEGL